MSHCLTSTLIIILMTASLSSKMYNWDSPWEECAFARTWFNYDNCWQSRFPCGLVLDGLNEESPVSYLFPNPALVSVLELFIERNTSITTSHKSRASDPSVRNPASNEVISDSLELWDTDVCFSHIQQKETNVRHPSIHKIPLMLIFLVLKVTSKIWVLKKAQSTMLCCISRMATLTIVSCVMNVWNQSCQSFITSLCPFCAWWSKFVHQCRRTSHGFCLGFFSVAPAEMCDSDISLYCCIISSFGLQSRWVHP